MEKYKKMLSDAKIACYSAQVRDCKGDTKELYKLVNTLMGITLSNLLPNHTNDKLLANEFADFFTNKIQKSRDNLTENPVYQLMGKSIPILTKFRPFMQTEVRKNHLQYEDQVMQVGCSANKTSERMH